MPPHVMPNRALVMTIVVDTENDYGSKKTYELIVRDINGRHAKGAIAVDRYLFLDRDPKNKKNSVASGWNIGDGIAVPETRYYSLDKWFKETSLSRVSAIAKRESKASGIPFDADAALPSWDDLRSGPWRTCAICQKVHRRTFDEIYVCDSCSANARVALQSGEVKNRTSHSAPGDILPHHVIGGSHDKQREEYGEKIILALCELLDQPIDFHRGLNQTTIGYVQSPYYTMGYQMTTSEARLKTMRQLVNLIREIAVKAHTQGVLSAKGLLVGLASGQFSIDEFNENVLAAEKKRNE